MSLSSRRHRILWTSARNLLISPKQARLREFDRILGVILLYLLMLSTLTSGRDVGLRQSVEKPEFGRPSRINSCANRFLPISSCFGRSQGFASLIASFVRLERDLDHNDSFFLIYLYLSPRCDERSRSLAANFD